MKLIDKDALLEKLSTFHPDYTFNITSFRNFIKAQPEVEKKGKWIHDGYDFPHGNDWIHCSECGKRGVNVPADLTNFCPNCGADMRGEQDG